MGAKFTCHSSPTYNNVTQGEGPRYMTDSAKRRKVASIFLGTSGLILFLVLAGLNAFNTRFLSPSTTGRILVFTGLSVVAFLLFVAVLVLLVRNVLKLYADGRSRVLGARLRTRMLLGAVLVSLVPIAFMFAFSYGLMNRAVDRWFSQPANQVRDDSNRMALELAQYTTANARVEAQAIAAALPAPAAPQGGASQSPPRRAPPRHSPQKGIPHAKARAAAKSSQPLPSSSHRPNPPTNPRSEREAILRVFREHEITLQNGFTVAFREGHPIAAFQMPPTASGVAQLKAWIPAVPTGEDPDLTTLAPAAEPAVPTSVNAAILAAAQRNDSPVFSLGDIDFALGTAAIPGGGTVVVGLPLPFGMAATMDRLRRASNTYGVLYRSRRQVRFLYTVLLLMMTSLALFAACWLALHLSKQVTKPVEAIADAMEAVAAGDYAHRVPDRVEESATEELGELVRSFNRMAADLEGSRLAVEQSTVQLSAANATLQARRSELETMLETIPNGIATLSPDRRIVLANRALSEMMDPGGQQPFLGFPMDTVFPAEVTDVLERLIRRSHRMGSASSEIELSSKSPHGSADRGPGTMNLLATVALLETAATPDRRREPQGYVLVLENATELLHAQKQSAWKEVARRVAHEIKNPLTPISLSAEQTRRHIDRLAATLAGHGIDSPSVAVIRRCSEVISSSVESMRSLVDQFSALAEFPTAQPRPADLNTIVESSLALFAGRLQHICILRSLSSDLPLVLADPEALKRALGNLIDNAAEAMGQSLLRDLRITTAHLDSGMIELTVADTGTGLTDDMRERLFLPYFSTKQRGTGLGLAIAAKIIQEHGGSIRAEKNEPAGARFIVELRPATNTDSDPDVDPTAAAAHAELNLATTSDRGRA